MSVVDNAIDVGGRRSIVPASPRTTFEELRECSADGGFCWIGLLHLFIGPDFVITVRHAEEPDLGAVRKRLEEDAELLGRGPFAVFYASSTGSSRTTSRCSTACRTTSTRSRSRSSAAMPAPPGGSTR